MTAMHTRRGPSRGERGETLIEFALALALFLATILGTMIFGIIVFRYNMLSDLAQEGARRASVCGFASGLRASGQCDVEAFVRSRALGIPLNSVTITPSDLTTVLAGQAVTVEVSHTFNPMTSILPVRPLTFSARSTMIASY
jgi:Flp pilus assembly protein TadG